MKTVRCPNCNHAVDAKQTPGNAAGYVRCSACGFQVATLSNRPTEKRNQSFAVDTNDGIADWLEGDANATFDAPSDPFDFGDIPIAADPLAADPFLNARFPQSRAIHEASPAAASSSWLPQPASDSARQPRSNKSSDIGSRHNELPTSLLIGVGVLALMLLATLGGALVWLRPSASTAAHSGKEVDLTEVLGVGDWPKPLIDPNHPESHPLLYDKPLENVAEVLRPYPRTRVEVPFFKFTDQTPAAAPRLEPTEDVADQPSERDASPDDLANRQPASDRRALQHLTPNPPAQFKPLPKMPALPSFAAKTLFEWPIAWSVDKALVLGGHEETASERARLIDLSKRRGGVQHAQKRSYFEHPRGISAAGLSYDSKHYAIATQAAPGTVEVRDAQTGKALYGVTTGQRPSQPIAWTDFDAEGNLLTLENGVLTSWKLGEQEATGRFAVHGKYDLPVQLSPDRRIAFISSGATLDVLDTTNGACLARLTYAAPEYVNDICLSPDGTRLSVLYSNWPESKDRQRDANRSRQMFHVGIWDLADGTLRVSQCPQLTKCLGWATPNHLVIGYSSLVVYDLERDVCVIHYSASRGFDSCERSSDGRLWGYAWRDGAYQVATVSGIHEAEEKALLDRNDLLFDFRATPVQVIVDMGSKAYTEECAGKVLEAAQGFGWKIAPSKYTMYVTGRFKNSDKELQLENGRRVTIPRMSYDWWLIERGGRVLFKGSTGEEFELRKSKYYTKSNRQYPLRLPSYRPGRALLNEMLENKAGLSTCGLDTRVLFLSSTTGPRPIPFDLPWKPSK